ncbi:MAG TPA: transcription termination factor Rho [Luteolibacter sp.]|nr:transcription termination factor Rho [Luteolibacter sp.]
MHVIVLTGGIACGKSTALGLLREALPAAECFDCDSQVHLLLDLPEVAAQVATALGPEMIGADGRADRAVLRQRVFADPAARSALEAVLHPRVMQECLASRDRAATRGADLFIADIPLFYEKGLDIGQDQVLVVAVSRATQIRRLKARGGFDDLLVESMVDCQMPVAEKVSRADTVFWNEGPPSILRSQIQRFSRSFPMTTDEPQAAEAAQSATAAPAAAPVPTSIDINEFRTRTLGELQAMAEACPARIPGGISKSQLVYELLYFFSQEGAELFCEGVIEQSKEKFAMLRDAERSFRPGQDDIHLNNQLIQDYGLRVGQSLKVKVKAPRERGKYLTAAEVLSIEGIPAAEYTQPKDFEKLTPLFPDKRIHLEGEGQEFLAVRVIDLIAPLGKGQRGIIVAPPRGGKTILLKQIAKSIRRNHPEAELVILLLDERPEEVTDFEETVGARVFASTFDEPAKRHAQVAELVIERAKRLVENGRDVILLLDSLTRLARGYNSAIQGGPIGSGGVNPIALQKARKFFGSARNVEEGGSLTVLATALVETESRLDDVVFEEFKGTGNMEVRLDRELAERRVFPAIHIPQSGTRNDDRLYHPDEFVKVLDIRRQLAGLPIGDAIETLLANLKASKSNAELLLRGLR